MGNFFKDTLKDKNKLLMLIPILLGILFVIVFFGKRERAEEATSTGVNQTFLEPDAKQEKKISSKVDAYKREKEEEARKKRELEGSKVKGSDFYFEMQSSEDEYNEKMKDRIEKMKKDPLEAVAEEYTEDEYSEDEYAEEERSGRRSFSKRMRQQLDEIEDQETFDKIVRDAKTDKKMRQFDGELEKAKEVALEEMRKKYPTQSLGEDIEKTKADTLPEVKTDTLCVTEQDSKPTFIVENGKRRRRSQLVLNKKVNLIKAAIYGDQTIVSGSAVRMRLLEPLWAGGVEIPANTIFYGNASVGASRLRITVENIRYGKFITPVAFTIYDSDAIEGLNLPNNMKAEAARKMEQGLLQGVQLPISSIGTMTSEITSAITATTQVARQILNQSLSQVKVHLKANYNMYIKEETKEDRKKREEEEAETERLFKEMQEQKNEPVKKNPLTKLIEEL